MRDFLVSAAPHEVSDVTVRKIMWAVNLSLLPAALGAVYFFGLKVLWIVGATVLASIATETAILALRRQPVTISDGSAFLTGLLLSLNLPQDIPLWLPVLGAVFAIGVVKQAFGGLGRNIFNPALGGRVFLLLAYSKYMTTSWEAPKHGYLSIDAVTSATPLTLLSNASRTLSDLQVAQELKVHASNQMEALYSNDVLMSLFTGKVGGCIGETSALLLILGAVFLLIKGHISWHIPFGFLFSLGLFTWIFPYPGQSAFRGNILFQLFSGGAILGAFYMATDMVTSPITRKGKLIFGFGCGLLTGIIRFYAGYPEGASFAILLMNAANPLIDRHTRGRIYGK